MLSTKTVFDYLVMLYQLNKCLLQLLYVNERMCEVFSYFDCSELYQFLFLFPSERISGIDVLAS